jgi:transcriptional regulator with XRE-family HTH domain
VQPLENLRRARTLNQTQLAKLVGISQQDLSKAERGQLVLSADLQARLAAILGASRDELFPTPTAADASAPDAEAVTS